ncbi:uncharacterized protein N7515_004761 [Penicillium bovifimosum]|uniref:Uncharacterized protein n=1 Tax=Penicillium bovifimosum TaxID=126998 RepID=A0A9W9L3M9_9EURO|nr:uncharacterized protein N7515_004761 [Penicillium bovifimosum]KAJ5135483.1 hypothetical protein N7515_004761 [Penicillium bovifimosum]
MGGHSQSSSCPAMSTVAQESHYLSPEILYSTAEILFPVTSVISLSLLGLILVYRSIKQCRRTRHALVCKAKQQHQERNPWCDSVRMEKGEIASVGSRPLTACDILRPLSQTSCLPSSGVLAAKAREEQSRRLASGESVPASCVGESDSVQKCNAITGQMHEEGVDGVRTWKRVVVEYR